MFHDTIPIGAGEALAPASIPPRQALIDAARAELRTRSPAQVTMQDVADRAGLSRRTLYNQFADRDCLFDAVVQELVGRIDNGMHFDPNDGGADELDAALVGRRLELVVDDHGSRPRNSAGSRSDAGRVHERERAHAAVRRDASIESAAQAREMRKRHASRTWRL